MFDWLHERHFEKGVWYMAFFGAGFAFGFITQLLIQNPLNTMLIYGITGGAAAVFFTFLTIEGGHHIGGRR